MSGTDTPPDGSQSETGGPRKPFKVRRRDRAAKAARRTGLVLLILLAVLAVLAAALYLNRRAAAREVLIGWLDQRGIEADVTIERLELDGFVGRIRIGDPKNPDLTVERAEVDYAIAAPWSSSGLGLTARRIRLVRPVLRASWKAGKLSLGSLDPLVEEFTGKPPRPDSRSPLVIVERGVARLDTEYGPVQVQADARIDNGKLMRLAARMPAASLKSGDVEARGLGGSVDLTTTGDRVALAVDLAAEGFEALGVSGETASLSARGDLPYPDLKTRADASARGGDGRAALNLAAKAAGLTAGDTRLRGLAATLAFDGTTTGWIETFRIAGGATAALSAETIAGPGVGARSLNARIDSGQLDLNRGDRGVGWSVNGPLTLRAAQTDAIGMTLTAVAARSNAFSAGGRGGSFEASGPVALSANRFVFGDLVLNDATGAVDLDVTHQGATLIEATGSVRSPRGAWPLFGPVTSDDVPELAEMKRALGNFALEAPGFHLTSGSPGAQIELTRPARLTPANGGVLTINPVSRPIYASEPGQLGGGALALTATRGKGLPEATVAVPDWRLTPGGFTARLDARAALDFGLARGLKLSTAGLLTSDAGVLTYAASDCIPFTVETLDLDENDVVDVAGRACPTDRPLVTVRDGRWRADGIVRGLSASAPFLEMKFAEVEAPFGVTGGPAGLGLQARVASARILDATDPIRFHPLTASGEVALADENWSGGFDIVARGHPLARMTLAHNGLTGIGGVDFDTRDLVFAPSGLQPSDLTPLVDDIVQAPVSGSARFTGRFAWDPALPEGSSQGRLVIPGIDFTSPAGPVRGLKGTVDFTSLAPLLTAPDQALHIDGLETVTPLTDLDVIFDIDASAIRVDGGAIRAAGGTVSVEPFFVPLDPTQPTVGVIVLDRIQLGDVIKGAGLDDKLQLDALVSGRIPFTYDLATGAKVIGGTLAAVQSGRLSIPREALADLDAGGGGAIPPNTVEDLAYQAMENLSFDTLSADLNSLDQGRIGVLFHIKGRHDPPQRQELRLTIPELISRDFLNRPLPLPSGTGIDLTLDTNLNLNQVISDLLAVNRARAGEADPAPPAPAVSPVADPTPEPSAVSIVQGASPSAP